MQAKKFPDFIPILHLIKQRGKLELTERMAKYLDTGLNTIYIYGIFLQTIREKHWMMQLNAGNIKRVCQGIIGMSNLT